MELTIADDWNKLVEVEPRLAKLLLVAVGTVAAGAIPDMVYRDVKPYISGLVGMYRGLPVQERNPSALKVAFVDILNDTTGVGRADSPTDLDSSRMYISAISYFYQRLCEVSERRESMGDTAASLGILAGPPQEDDFDWDAG